MPMFSFHFSLDEIDLAARKFWAVFPDATIFAFHGAMGAGKTTFINALCKAKGVTEITGSPTFSIINDYLYEDKEGSHHLYHIDLYRIRDAEEAMQAGVEDCLYSGALCLVEWPGQAETLFPPQTVHLSLTIGADQQRILNVLPEE